MKRSLFILTSLLVLTVLAAGCGPKLPPEQPWEKDAVALLGQSEALAAKKQYPEALRLLDTYFSTYPTSRNRDRGLFLGGELRLATRDYSRALSYYKEIIEKHPSSPFIPDAKYKLGICYYEVGELDLAIANLQDRGKITDPDKLRRISEVLSSAYLTRKNFIAAVREFSALEAAAPSERQRLGYRDRIREIMEKELSEHELRDLAAGPSYPADAAGMRLAALLMEQRKYAEALDAARDFLARFPNHPERTRVEMMRSQAAANLTKPRFFLGVMVPQSGQTAFFGDRVLRGVQLAVYAYNQQHPDGRIEVIVKDTGGSPQQAISALNALHAEGVSAVVGPLLTRDAESIAPLLAKVRVPVITPAASGPGIGILSPWLFRNALTNAVQADAAAAYAVERRLRRFVILYPEDPYGRDLARLFAKALSRKIEVLASVGYDPEAKDFGPFIRKLIEIDLRSRKIAIPENEDERKKLLADYTPGFDAIYLPGAAGSVGLLIPQLAFYNMSGLAMIGSNSWHAPELIDRADRHAEGAVFPDGFAVENPDAAVQAMVDAYRSAYQEDPDILAAQAYDAARMVLSCIDAGRTTPAGIQECLLSLRDFPGVSGITSFPGSGEAQKRLFFITVSSGRFALTAN